MYFEVPKGFFQGLKQRITKGNRGDSPRIVDKMESIFNYEYPLEFESKLEQDTAIV